MKVSGETCENVLMLKGLAYCIVPYVFEMDKVTK
jgi:hypothetical protein